MPRGISGDPRECDFLPGHPIGNGGPPDPWAGAISLIVFAVLIIVISLLK